MSIPEIPNGVNILYRITELEKDLVQQGVESKAGISGVNRKLDRLMWAVVTLAFSITASAIVFAITVAATKGSG